MTDMALKMTMRTRVAIECARKRFPIAAEDLVAALVELHDILHTVAGESAGYRVLAERYQMAFTSLQKEIIEGVSKVVEGVEAACRSAEKIIVEDGTVNLFATPVKADDS